MAGTRNCEQCGAVFLPRRGHARFCRARCRVIWNRARSGDPAAEDTALLWSVTAMTETTERLGAIRAWDRPRAVAAIGAAVWQVTLVDATLARHYPEIYDRILASQAPARRLMIDETLAGLRFVRNHIGREASLSEFIQVGGTTGARITIWTWKVAPRPALAAPAPRSPAWETARHGSYQAYLAGYTIGHTFDLTADFLNLVAADALSVPARARPLGGHGGVRPTRG